MGSRPRPPSSRHGIALALALAVAGCSTSTVQLSTGGPQPTVATQGASTLGALITIGVLGAFAYDSQSNGVHYNPNPFEAISPGRMPPAPLDPQRRVLEQDCSKPIEDWSANLRCR